MKCMYKKRNLLLTLSFFVVLHFPVEAAEARKITLEECWKTALENNPELKEERAKTEQYRHSYLAGLNDLYPKISFSHSASVSGSQGTNSSNSYSTSLSASENIFSLKTLSSVKRKRLSYEQAAINYKVKSASLRYKVSKYFLELLFMQEKIKVYEKIARLRKDNAKLIRLKYESGLESKGNMLYAQAQSLSAETNLKNARRSLVSAVRNLCEVLGLKLDTRLRAAGTFTVPEKIPEESILKKLDENPSLLSADKDIEKARQTLLSARYDLYPKLTASQSLSWSGSRELPSSQSWSLGLSLSLPLFSGGPTYIRNNVRTQSFFLKALKEKRKNLRRGLESQLRQALLDFENAMDRVKAAEKMLEANRERYKESRIRYMAGKMSFIDLKNIEQNLVDSETDMVQNIKNAYLGKFSIENILGKDLEDKSGL